jgi:hypothetical protein
VLVPAPPQVERVAAALAPLLEDAGRRRRLGDAGRERFRRDFTVEAWGMRMRPVYEAAIAARAARG